ncbi:Bifunctional oligoribonuclease and PAP phosphatase NrnA [Clostridium sp. N3C]|uniref:DHH family phosphoesterase n=1 Tax=Clostridium sp. N3C TaxID=1776758 RepID=UPI00092E0081|nr:bifunctional oligoribonuclease/PAP phosphatase NrnA [Clostridium sp. N3C]SCN21908.1 Bifunctional oligoribonuclease and PAP phosphatase NrnA [Clostridium sp. N3C]
MLKDIAEVIKKSKNLNISFHVSPDGDSIGSALALMHGLRKLNKNVNIICKETVPEVFNYLSGVDEINQSTGKLDYDVDCVIVLDCGNVERINFDISDLKARKCILLNIDHHLSNDYYGDINYVDASHSAVGEIVYLLLKELGIDIDAEIAKCLYTSIITDCGSFRFSNTTNLTHKIAGDLISIGIDFPAIHSLIYENKNYSLVKLSGKVIDNMFLCCENKVCFMEVSQKLLEEFSVDSSDASSLVDIGTTIKGVEVVVFIKENTDGYKVSLRSKKKFDVRKLAEEFGGGGHSKAAGFTYRGNLDELKSDLIYKIGVSL